jgi:hypothetical protein
MLHNKWLVYYDTSKQHIYTVCEQIAESLMSKHVTHTVTTTSPNSVSNTSFICHEGTPKTVVHIPKSSYIRKQRSC